MAIWTEQPTTNGHLDRTSHKMLDDSKPLSAC